jgi:hypothetical protein
MRKVAFLIGVGVALGYSWGFSDAQRNKDNVVVRVIERVGGKNRDRMRMDVDRQLDSLER